MKRLALVAVLVIALDAAIALLPRNPDEWWSGLYLYAAAVLSVALALYAAVLVVMRIKRSRAAVAKPERSAEKGKVRP